MDINKQIYITSLNKSINLSKYRGNLDLSLLSLYNLYLYYINFTDKLQESGITLYSDINKQLKLDIDKLKYKYPDIICNYKVVINNINNIQPSTNTAPTVLPSTINIGEDNEYLFTVADFTNGYFDAEGDSYSTIIISKDSLNGSLIYNGNEITTIEIPVNLVNNLKYIRTDENAFSNDIFKFKIADSNINKKYSLYTNIILNGDAIENQPATIGDNTIYTSNRTTTILSLAMFTSQLHPPYSDPEGDLIDAIRIDEISTANLGFFQLNNTNVVVGQIITREDLNAGLFTHVGPDQDAINSDVINFSARDEGSLKWVQ